MSSKPWVRYHTKPGPACSKVRSGKKQDDRVLPGKPGPACSKRKNSNKSERTSSPQLPVDVLHNLPASNNLQEESKMGSTLEKSMVKTDSLTLNEEKKQTDVPVSNENTAIATDKSMNEENTTSKKETETVTAENGKDNKTSDRDHAKSGGNSNMNESAAKSEDNRGASGENDTGSNDSDKVETLKEFDGTDDSKEVSGEKDTGSNDSDKVETLKELDGTDDFDDKMNKLPTAVVTDAETILSQNTDTKTAIHPDAQSSDLLHPAVEDNKGKQPLENMSDENLMKELSKDELMKVLESKNCVCPCGHIIPDNVLRSIHTTIHAASNPLKCSECNVVFGNYYKFQGHSICKLNPK